MSDLILVGRIMGPHGIRGAVKIKSFTADPAALAHYAGLQLAGGRAIEFLRMKPAGDVFIADLRSVTDRNAAEALQGAEIFVPRQKLPAPGADEFYLNDLLGRSIAASGGGGLGTVTGFQNYGAGDLVELDTGLLIPVAFIKVTAEAITADLPEGFLSEDDTPPGRGGRP